MPLLKDANGDIPITFTRMHLETIFYMILHFVGSLINTHDDDDDDDDDDYGGITLSSTISKLLSHVCRGYFLTV